MANDFPEILNEVLTELALQRNFKLLKETHYESLNRELQWLDNKTLNRIDFDYSSGDLFVIVTVYRDRFKIFPRFLIWCHNNIPMFPYCAKIKWNKLGKLSLELSKDELKKHIEECILNKK